MLAVAHIRDTLFSQSMIESGVKLGAYEILDRIGAGGMGEVYRAIDPRIGRKVAIKVLPSNFAENADRLARFEQEARAAGMLNHPGILNVYDVGHENGRSFSKRIDINVPFSPVTIRPY